MDEEIYSDDEHIENTVNNHDSNIKDNIYNNSSINNSSNINNDYDNSNINNNYNDNRGSDDDDDFPAASGTMMLAEQHPLTSIYSPAISTISYTGYKVMSLLSWIGSGLYSLTDVFNNTVSPEEQHMHVLNTIAKLNNHLVFLDKKIESMNRNSSRFSERAKQLYKSKKLPSAIHQIRLKKMYDCEISKLEKLKFNIETNILHMDSVEIMMVTVDTIKDTSEHFKKINSTLNIEKLEDTIDELVEHRDASTDIQSVLNDMQLFNEANYDEEDLMKELQMISGEDIDISEANISEANISEATHQQSTIQPEDLPEAPSTELPHNNNDNHIQITTTTTDNNLELSGIF